LEANEIRCTFVQEPRPTYYGSFYMKGVVHR